MAHITTRQAAGGLLSTLLLLGCLPIVVHGQGNTASIAGIVRDQQNLVVPSATVRIAGVENAFSRAVTTDADGAFEFAGLLPGDYKMSVELQGFAREEHNVTIAVNQRV